MESKAKTYQLRPYQVQAVNNAVAFFKSKLSDGDNAVEVLPTGSGKSLIISNIALRLGEPILIFQPSKEILEQNYQKISSYGMVQCGIFSASFGRREIAPITFCTIGSVMRFLNVLKGNYKYCLIDECHSVNANGGQYKTMIKYLGLKVIGLTATPYRLWHDSYGSVLRFITQTIPRIFSKVIHVTQVEELLKLGFLAKLNYYQVRNIIDKKNLVVNSTGFDYTEKSLRAEYQRVQFNNSLENIIRRLFRVNRNRILVFTHFVEEATQLAKNLPNTTFVTGETPKKERERILNDFKSGKIHCVANVGVLTTGFDYPELDTVVLGRPTRSLALYYQMVGRALRPYPNKQGWIVDLCDTYSKFGKVENLEMRCEGSTKWAIWNKETNEQITNVYF